jgi:hypothetical protein
VAVGDFNGDGFLDLAIIFAGGVRVLLGNGDGTFQTTPLSYIAGSGPSSLAVGDFNGDNWPDLAVANASSNDVSILLNDGAWTGPHPSPGLSPSRQAGQVLGTPTELPFARAVTWLDPAESRLPGSVAPSDTALPEPLTSPVLRDALFGATPPAEFPLDVPGTRLLHPDAWSAGLWHQRIHDLAAFEEALVALARAQL